MRLAIIAAMLLGLSACGTTRGVETPEVTPISMPPLPSQLSRRAGRLPDITDPTMGGDQVRGAEDDQRYNQVAWQLNTVITAWECVRQAMQNRTDPVTCFNPPN